MSLTAPERETVVNFSDADDVAYIYTAQRRVITKLKKNPTAVLIEEGVHDGSVWARFELPKEFISFRSAKRAVKPLTEQERRKLTERLRRSRSAV
jgi:hypothetical protein